MDADNPFTIRLTDYPLTEKHNGEIPLASIIVQLIYWLMKLDLKYPLSDMVDPSNPTHL
jgi:hypothetical protein